MKYAALMLMALLGLGIEAQAQFYVYKNGEVVYMIVNDVPDEVQFVTSQDLSAFVEANYRNIPTKTTCYWSVAFNWGEDEYINPSSRSSYTYENDEGDFGAMYDNSFYAGFQSYLYGTQRDESGNRMDHHMWNGAWSSIKKCNAGLIYMEKNEMADVSDDEKALIKGQLLFFRAWWYQELMMYFG